VRLQDIVLLVLSKQSLASNWVWLEIEWALEKEQAEGRYVLCPVALDDSWETYTRKQRIMRQVQESNILDFSAWETNGFDVQFDKLLRGMKTNYEARK
jgi:hypothetical protein